MFADMILSLNRYSHPNVVPFIGVIANLFQMVVERISDGNLMKYLEEHPETDRISLVSRLLFIAFEQLR